MVTTEFSVFGNWFTGSPNTDRRPSTTMSRLTTRARTGFRMKRSVKFIASASLFLRRGVRVVLGHDALVVRRQGRAVLQLEPAARHDDRALVEALEDRDLVAAGRARGDEDLLGHEALLLL